MRIWITGINGFLGGHLAEALRDVGHDVGGNDNGVCGTHDIVYKIDCRFYDNMKVLFEVQKTDVLIHCAATAHEGLSNFSPSFITKNIYEASVATFSAAIAAGVKRIIFMSSMARYGAQDLPFHEGIAPKPIDPYGIAKVAAEDTLKALCKLHDVEYVIAVPHNIIGPRQRYNDPYRNVASIMINRALQGKPILVYGDGQQTRCFSPVSDCLDSLVKMIDAPINGEIINIGPDQGQITVLELAKIIQELTAKTPSADEQAEWQKNNKSVLLKTVVDIQHVPARPNEVMEAYCSSDKARRLLGFSPKKSLRDCLAEMVRYIKDNGTKPFDYSFPIEIEKGCPLTWKDKLI